MGIRKQRIGSHREEIPSSDRNSGPIYQTPPLEQDLYFGGLPRLHINVNTATVGGQIYALLEDCDGNNCIHIGHAIMDLRYHAGGTEEQAWVPVLEDITAYMEFLQWMLKWKPVTPSDFR